MIVKLLNQLQSDAFQERNNLVKYYYKCKQQTQLKVKIAIKIKILIDYKILVSKLTEKYGIPWRMHIKSLSIKSKSEGYKK